MRYMSLIRVSEDSGPAEGPGPEVMEEMGKLIDEMTKAGVMLDTGGLRPTSEGTRLRWNHGDLTVTDGPFTETKEFIGGYAIIQAKSKEEAIEWTKRFLRIHGDAWDITCELRQVEEPEL
jgi:hypothetical protein